MYLRGNVPVQNTPNMTIRDAPIFNHPIFPDYAFSGIETPSAKATSPEASPESECLAARRFQGYNVVNLVTYQQG